MAAICKIGGPLTLEERRKLPDSAFGLPARRAYPMPDVSHARNAKARAAQQQRTGGISLRELQQINKKADRIIERCAGNPNGGNMTTAVAKRNGNPNPNPAPLWPWVVGGLLSAAAVGGAVWWYATRDKKKPPSFPGVPTPPPPPAAHEIIECEPYKGRILCVVKPLEGLPKLFAWTADGGDPHGEFILPQLAMVAAKTWVDSLEEMPLPPLPTEPEATAEGEAAPVSLEFATKQHGIIVAVEDGQCKTFTIDDLGLWFPWAVELLNGLNLEAWTSAELMDNVWEHTFPQCGGDLSSVAGVTIGGQPYGEVIQAGQAFLDAYKGDVIGLAPGQSVESVFAGKMVGQAYVAPPPEPLDPTEFPMFEIGPGGQIRKMISTTGVKWTVVLLPQNVYHVAAGQHVFSVPWFAWSEGTELRKENAQHQGSSSSNKKSLDEATAAIG